MKRNLFAFLTRGVAAICFLSGLSVAAPPKPSATGGASPPLQASASSEAPPDGSASEPAPPTRTSTTDTESDLPSDAPTPPEAPRERDPDDEARLAYQEGDRAFLEGDYATAIREFQRAYQLSGRMEMLFNLANAYERMGRYELAGESLRGYLPHAPVAQRPVLERRLERLAVLGVERRRRQATRQRPISPPSPSAPRRPPAEDRKTDLGEAVGYGLIGLGAAGVGVGVGFGIAALNARSEAEGLCTESGGRTLCPSSARDAVDRDASHSLVADVAVLAGLVAAGTGVYLILSTDDDGEEIRAGVLPGGFNLWGTF